MEDTAASVRTIETLRLPIVGQFNESAAPALPQGTGADQAGAACEGYRMSRKLPYTLAMFAFIVMSVVDGFAAAVPAEAQPAAQNTVVPPTVVPTVMVAATELVPVTGKAASTNVMMLLFSGFLGMLAIVLLTALFASARRTAFAHNSGPPHPPKEE